MTTDDTWKGWRPVRKYRTALPGEVVVSVPDPSCRSGVVQCIFNEIDTFIVGQIQSHDLAVGCTAYWSPDSPIIAALQAKEIYSLVVSRESSKEIKPPSGNFPIDLLRDLETELYGSVGIRPDAEVRAVEYIAKQEIGDRYFPRLHSKFLVLMDRVGSGYMARKVITGSYNFSRNASVSFENVVCIEDEGIAFAYLRHWYQAVLVALDQRNPEALNAGSILEMLMDDEVSDAIREMDEDPLSAYSFHHEERLREIAEDEEAEKG